MTIRNLEIFAAVCEYMSMSKAAGSLMISQSSVSQAVSALEKECGVVLFERLNHKLYLTDAGHILLYQAQQVLQCMEQLEKAVGDGALCHTLRLGASTTIGDCLIYPLTQKFAAERDVVFDVEINNSKALEKKLLTAKLDAAILQAATLSPYLAYVPLLRDDMTIICRPDHEKAGTMSSLIDLAEESFVVREKGSGTEIILEQTFADYNLHLKKCWRCNNPGSVKQAVMHGVGIALVSKYLVQSELSQGILGEIHMAERLFTRDFVLAYHQDKRQDACFAAFVAFCKNLGHDGVSRLILNNI